MSESTSTEASASSHTTNGTHTETTPTNPLDAHDIEHLSAEHRAKLDEFHKKIREVFANDRETDFTYLRFLRARKFDIDAAFAMYSKYLKWRKDDNIDDILVHPPTEIRKVLAAVVPESFHKFDKYGLPAYFIKAGAVVPSRLLNHIDIEDMVRTHLWGMEYSFQRAAESSKLLGKNVDQFVNIVDLSGFGISHLRVINYMRRIADLDQQYYPEALGKTYVINAPWIFPKAWNLIKSFIDPVTVAKVMVLGHDYQKHLQERFNPESLPKEYGGTCECEGGCVHVYSDAEATRIIAEYEEKKKQQKISEASVMKTAETSELPSTSTTT
jgi:hypothetical protein